jgi:hypothetical protein
MEALWFWLKVIAAWLFVSLIGALFVKTLTHKPPPWDEEDEDDPPQKKST